MSKINTTHYTGWRWMLAVIRKWWLWYAIWLLWVTIGCLLALVFGR
jgi:hypothetical protein